MLDLWTRLTNYLICRILCISEVIKERFDKAGELLNTILNEICKEMLMLAPDDIAYEPADEERVVAKVVDKFLADLDQNFLAVVEAYETQATEAGLEMRKLIRKVRMSLFQRQHVQLFAESMVHSGHLLDSLEIDNWYEDVSQRIYLQQQLFFTLAAVVEQDIADKIT